MTTSRSDPWSEAAIEAVEGIDSLVGLMRSHDGSTDSDFEARFHSQLQRIEDVSRRCQSERARLLAYCLKETSAELSESVIHHQGREQPFGYAGDFQIIDWTYIRFAGSPGRGALWDEFYHRQDAPLAVCDRKDRFGRLLKELACTDLRRPLRVLNVASGPGRELLDGAQYANLSPEDLDVLCVEIDPRAVNYSRQLLGDRWSKAVRFHQGNALRFRPPSDFDFVWCAGLFDYLEDRLAAFLMRNLWNAVAPGGRLIIGNFSTSHRTRPWIEWCGNWFLIHRSQEDIAALANDAGIPEPVASHDADRWNAIRFLTAVKLT